MEFSYKEYHPVLDIGIELPNWLDREMPKIEGFKMLRMLKTDPAIPHIPVIMLTSKGQAAEISEGRKAGTADYMVKPFARSGSCPCQPDTGLARLKTDGANPR